MSEEMPVWPVVTDYVTSDGCAYDYETFHLSIATATLALLHRAESALQDIKRNGHGYSQDVAEKALADIGPLPPLPEEPR